MLSVMNLRRRLLCLVAIVAIFNLWFMRYHIQRNQENTKKIEENIKHRMSVHLEMIYNNLPDDQSKQYKIHRDYSLANDVMPGDNLKDVTLVTHATVNQLHRLLSLADRWNGPISIVVFAPGNDARMTKFAIDGLRQCNTYIKDSSSFHLVYPIDLLPPFDGGNGNLYSEKESESSKFCSEILPRAIQSLQPHSSYENEKTPYPSNLLRNLGRDAAQTNYVFVIDIDMLPNKGLYHEVVNFLQGKDLFENIADKTAFVVPAFEMNIKDIIPDSKKQLQQNHDKVRPFYHEVCAKCQNPVDYERWWKADWNDGALATAYTLNWKDPWEPFFIINWKSPLFDERFKQYGFNRISHTCELHLAGYEFSILNNAFLVHKGLKKPSSFHSLKNAQNDRNRDLFRTFKKEIKSKYANTDRHC